MNKYFWREILLFSFIGVFSLFIITQSTDISTSFYIRSLNAQSIFAAILTYNGLGLTVLWIKRRLINSDLWFKKKYWQMGLVLIGILLLMFIFNYLLLVGARLIVEVPDAFELGHIGWNSLLFVWLIQVVIVCLLLSNSFYRNMVSLHRRNAQLQKAEMVSHYKALQSQLNPHFLFNSLNTLVSEIEYDPNTAIKFTRNLSDVYRYILQCEQKKTVTLREELDFLSSYLFLHIVRLGPCIQLNKKIPEELLDRNLPPLTLQLIVENIVKHNVISSSKPMTIEIYVEDHGNKLCVSNPICLKQDVVSAGKGLENLRQRYYLLSQQGIDVAKINKCFVVKVPLL